MKMKKLSKKQNSLSNGKDILDKIMKEDPSLHNLIMKSKKVELNKHDDSEENGDFSVDEDVSDDVEEEDSDVEEESDENDATLEIDSDENDASLEESDEDESNSTLAVENGESDVSMEEEDDSGGELSDEEDDDDSDGSLSGEVKMSKILSKNGRAVEITLKLVEQWKKQLQEPKPLETFLNISKGLMTSINSINCQENSNKNGKVMTPDVFNKLAKVCLLQVPVALHKLLNLRNLSMMSSSKKFKKLSPAIKTYVQNLIQLLNCVTDSGHKAKVLELGILPLIECFKGQPQKGEEFLTDLITIWSTGTFELRQQAFRAIFRMVKLMNAEFLDTTLKKMYRAYTKNCRFTSQSTLGCIQLMKLSICELYSLDKNLAYKHGFAYIPHLKAAVYNKKLRTVYNWQFVHCLNLWCTMLSTNCPDNVLDPLVHPVIEVALEAINLKPIPRFHPLMLHIAAILTEFSSNTGIFIPVLPVLMNVFTEVKVTKKDKDEKTNSASNKTPNWDCTLKISDSEFKCHSAMRSLLQKTMLQMVQYLACISHSIGFPEMVLSAIVNLKKCEKRKEAFCQSYVKQLLAKITLQCEYIEERRETLTFSLKDSKKIADWEITRKQEQMPMPKFLKSLEQPNVQYNGKRKREEDVTPTSVIT